MTATKRASRYTWVTWLPKLMAGEISCEWAPWFRTNHANWDRPPEDFAMWRVKHTRLLREIKIQKEAEGYTVYTERQNEFSYVRDSGLVMQGRPDLVLVRGNETIVVDAKTGVPKASDNLQVMIYMFGLGRCHPRFKGKEIGGQVAYQNNVLEIAPDAIDESFLREFEYFLDIVDSETMPVRVPSHGECSFCNIGHGDCPERMAGAVTTDD